MTVSAAPRRRDLLPRWTAVLAAGMLAATALLLPALPAAAHDELVSTDPAADATLDAAPSSITFTFSADVLADPGATVVEVTDASGAALTDGSPEVAGATVTQNLDGAASGAVSVKWRVVSSDGHPISGDFAFTVAAASPSATPSASTAPTTPPPSAASSSAPTPSETAAPVETASPASPLPWILLGVALVVVAGVLVYVFASRGGRNAAGGGTAGR